AETNEGVKNHSRVLMPFIDSCIKKSGVSLSDLDAVAISKGPGSFTGLRIGVATAKGICFAIDKPLLAVNTLQSMASLFNQHHKLHGTLFCPMIDARRKEVYTAIFDQHLDEILETNAVVLNEDSFEEWSAKGPIAFFGDGAAKSQNILKKSDKHLFFNDFRISAEGMNALCLERFAQNKFESLSYFEPFYLKDFYSPAKST
ncbi:MAG: tRNA (adenosine(37)-N6)-threonylcarbamoyltransferase complex dimerization subunit type 1 TsaB, partial [Bacteroidota bacterium]